MTSRAHSVRFGWLNWAACKHVGGVFYRTGGWQYLPPISPYKDVLQSTHHVACKHRVFTFEIKLVLGRVLCEVLCGLYCFGFSDVSSLL